MDLDFIEELQTVFNILKYNPEAIVDDTAIERLLNWLEEICSQKNTKLIDKSLEFFKSEEIWKNSLTLSFALRFAGYLGHHNGTSNEQLVTVIKNMLQDLTKHEKFSIAAVQYGFYQCLVSLSKDIFWCCFLEGFLEITLEKFKKSYLYVKKAAVAFFASFLHTVLLNDSSSLSVVYKMIEPICDHEQLYQITESILLVSEQNALLSLTYLSRSKLIQSLMLSTKLEHGATTSCQVVKALESIFSMLTSIDIEVDWQSLLSEKNIEEILLNFIKFVKSKTEFQMNIPSICKSLMITSINARFFSPAWNYKLLQFALLDLSYHNDSLRKIVCDSLLHDYGNILQVKVWKKLLTITMNEMIQIEKKIGLDPLCEKLLVSWRSYCLKILAVSLSNGYDGKVIDEYLITVMHDKKIPRLCFLYLKEIPFEVFDKELYKEFMGCLWNCLCCHTDSAQVVCATLELFLKYISRNESNLAEFMEHPNIANSPFTHVKTTLPEIMNKLLWDTNWEVKDSLIDILMKLMQSAKEGSKVSKRFLEENTFWVKVIDLINNQESYIRSKTVTFIGKVVLYQSMWEIFCNKYNYCILDLCQLLQDTFTCDERQDDIFTRRSTLQVIKVWILSDLEYIPIFSSNDATTDQDSREMKDTSNTNNTVGNMANHTSNIGESAAMKRIIYNILENGSRDFDWEVRKLTFSMWKDMAAASSEKTQNEKDLFLNLFIESNFALITCNGMCDCEYLVKMEAFHCLKFIKNNFIKNSNIATEIVDPVVKLHGSDLSTIQNNCWQNKSIKTINDYENCLKDIKDMDKKTFEGFIGQVDLEYLSNQLDVLDVTVSRDPISFVEDIIASAKQSDANLLDCY